MIDLTNVLKPIRTRSFRLGCTLLYVGSLTFARQSPQGGWTTDTLASKSLGKRAIYIATPEGYEGGTTSYPIVVMLDANDHPMFKLWIAQAAYLARNSAGLPQVIAVGIPNGLDRFRDMLPPATGSSVQRFKTAGGASAFADFILDEVLPYVRARYRTVPGTFLIGHSAGGVFALDVAANRPSAFKGIVATSPAIWYNDEALVGTYTGLMAASKTHPRIFFSYAINEGSLAAACKHFDDTLKTIQSLSGTFESLVYPNASHTLTPMSVQDGLQFIFDPVAFRHLPLDTLRFKNVDSVSLNETLRSSERGYASAARSLGLREQLPEEVINQLGYNLINVAKPTLALAIFHRNTQEYPQSVNVWDSLGDGFLAAGDTASAIATFRKSLEVARTIGAPALDETKVKLQKLEKRK